MAPRTIILSSSIGTIPVRIYFQNLAIELANRGHKVILLVTNPEKIPDFPSSKVILIGWPNSRPVHFADFLFFRGILKQYKPDCVIGNWAAGNIMMFASMLKKVPLRIMWYHTQASAGVINGTAMPIKIKFLILRKNLTYIMANRLFTNSKNTAEEFNRTFYVKRPIEVFTFGLADPVTTLHISLDQPIERRFMFVGRLIPSKGVKTLLNAIALIKDLNFTVTIAGMGKTAEYETMAGELGITEKCCFVGSLPWTQLLTSLSTAIAMVFPTQSEALGMVNIESISIGTPVLASKVGGIPEVIEDGVDGFLLPVDDAKAFSEKMRLLLEDDSLRMKLSKNARKHFLERFESSSSLNSFSNHAIRIESLLEQA
jgi:glycosyltransferase involved in cell wall biosynthesis